MLFGLLEHISAFETRYTEMYFLKSQLLYLALGWVRVKIYPKMVIFVSGNCKTTICYFHRPSFSSSDIHQPIAQSGCQEIGINSSFIEAF